MAQSQSNFSDDALVVEQFNSLTRNIPSVFVNILIMSGIYCWFIEQQFSSNRVLWLVAPLVLICGGRAWYWRNLGRRDHGFSIDRQRRMIRLVWILCLSLCCGFAGIVALTLTSPDIFVQSTIAILIIASSIAIALHLFTVPPAALGALWSATACTIYVFTRTGNSILFAASVALLVLAIAITKLLLEHFDNFRKLVHSRAEVELMRAAAVDLAMTDALTGLPNRRMFEARLQECAGSGGAFAVAVIDLDGFKPINDLYGHSVGDLFLAEAARRMRQAGGAALVARMGGDEFAMLIEGLARDEDAVAIACDAVAAVSAPYALNGIAAPMGASGGVAVWREAGDEARVVERADIALYQAKAGRRGSIVAFSEALEREVQRRAMIEAGLREAVLCDAFEVRFQPIVDLASGALTSFEALARWRHGELGEIPPNVFIPIAEQAGLIEIVTDRLLRKAALAATRWPAQVALSFNLSALQLVRPGAATTLLETLAECGLSPRRFEVEVTETAIMSDFVAATATISALKLSGARVSLDDFGRGYSSFSEMCCLPLDKVKIDKSFIDKICNDARVAGVVGAIVKMCSGLDQICVAEGVETQAQRDLLEKLGCAMAQGYFFARPMPAEDALALAEESFGERRLSA